MRRTAADRAAVSAVPAMVQDVIRSPGHSLDPGVRSRMELGLGHDFSRVRVHADPRAHQAAAAVDALAYSVGPHVVFGAGQYAPETPAGTRLLAHELAHVAQQESAPVPADLTLDGGPMDPLEIEADRAASHVAEQSPHGSVRAGAGPAVVHRRVRPENVSCRTSGLTNPNLTGAEAVAAIEAADADAIVLAQGAEQALDDHLAAAQAGDPVDAAFDTILREELGLTFTNAA
ncbi:MAG TPA: DUF4157 domain-containing protein, partial [Actinomycetota bacterium]|nr:DUF4157 domain-containing protein [Actinomycetota bacterium]